MESQPSKISSSKFFAGFRMIFRSIKTFLKTWLEDPDLKALSINRA